MRFHLIYGFPPASRQIARDFAEALEASVGEGKVLLKYYGRFNTWKEDTQGQYSFKYFYESLKEYLDTNTDITDVVVTGPGLLYRYETVLERLTTGTTSPGREGVVIPDVTINNTYIVKHTAEDQVAELKAKVPSLPSIVIESDADEKARLISLANQTIDTVKTQYDELIENIDEWVGYGGFDSNVEPVVSSNPIKIASL